MNRASIRRSRSWTPSARSQPSELGSVLNGLAELAEHDDPWVAAAGLVLRGHVAENSADSAGAARQFRAARDAFAALGDRWGMTMALHRARPAT